MESEGKSSKMRFLRTLTVTPSMTSDWGPSLPSVTSVPVRSIRSLPLPKLGLNNSCWNAGQAQFLAPAAGEVIFLIISTGETKHGPDLKFPPDLMETIFFISVSKFLKTNYFTASLN